MPDPAPWAPRGAPADVLSSGEVTLRRWRAGDAEIMDRLVSDNVEHLRPTMPWIASEPMSVGGRREMLTQWEAQWDAHSDFVYLTTLSGVPAGSAGLHVRQGAGVLEIGYWTAHDAQGHGVATTAARLLADAALAMEGVHAVEIHHDAYNTASGRVAEKAGFTAVSYYPRAPQAPDDSGTARRWVRLRVG